MSSRHFVANLKLTLHSHEDLHHLDHAWSQIISFFQTRNFFLQHGFKNCHLVFRTGFHFKKSLLINSLRRNLNQIFYAQFNNFFFLDRLTPFKAHLAHGSGFGCFFTNKQSPNFFCSFTFNDIYLILIVLFN